MSVASPILPPARSSKSHDKQGTRPKTQRIAQDIDDSCNAVAVDVPCMAILGFLHPREAESGSFLACVATTKQRLAAARTRPCTPSLSSTLHASVVVSRVLREMLRYSDRKKTMALRNTLVRGFAIGRKFVRSIF